VFIIWFVYLEFNMFLFRFDSFSMVDLMVFNVSL